MWRRCWWPTVFGARRVRALAPAALRLRSHCQWQLSPVHHTAGWHFLWGMDHMAGVPLQARFAGKEVLLWLLSTVVAVQSRALCTIFWLCV